MINGSNFDDYGYLDQGESLSFVNLYVANRFDVILYKLYESFCISTPLGESIVAEYVYRDCVISINCNYTMNDLIELYMIYFDVILGIE